LKMTRLSVSLKNIFLRQFEKYLVTQFKLWHLKYKLL
jgi:hypothetical protein